MGSLSQSPAQRGLILVVDDIPTNIQLLTAYLSSVGYSVEAARDGQEALEKVHECRPDLILLDVMMPKVNGFEVCKSLKMNNQSSFIPIIMVTGLNEVEHKVRAMEAGADDFVTKPFNRLELLTRVKSLLRIKQLYEELETAKESLRQLSITDGLTGLYNYRYFKEHLDQELNRASRHNLNVSVAMADIDFFKKFNDAHGHPAGDAVLRAVGHLLKDNIRKIDLAARYGGEEFSLVLVETNKPAAAVVAEKIKKLVEEHLFQNTNGNAGAGYHVTISMGVATFPDDAVNSEALIKIADDRLYRAKENGRNCVVLE
jgi:diguanylate cyclase (GGDEF)-like protein